MQRTVLLIAATTGYQIRAFDDAARSLNVKLILATDRCHVLDDPWNDRAIPVRFEDLEAAAQAASSQIDRAGGIIAVGDRPAEIAALAARKLGLPFHPAEAVAACRNKFTARERFRTAGLLVPDYFRVPLDMEPPEAARSAQYPCVLKPLGLSASRGVIRADDETGFIAAFERIRRLLATPDIRRMRDEQDDFIQVERFIPGREFALEGLVTGGILKAIALFDKPDPLEGPFFEETIYVTPSRSPSPVQDAMIRTTQKAVAALGLTHGPVHAEMRFNEAGVWMLEVAARPIGGLCARCLRCSEGMSLEELVLRHALGEDVSPYVRESCASAVMMIPVPTSGMFVSASGMSEAKKVSGIDDVIITAKEGQRIETLPEGASYLGFIFARSEAPEEAEESLRQAHARLHFKIASELPVVGPVPDTRAGASPAP
jgi:biotin carboxylase